MLLNKPKIILLSYATKNFRFSQFVLAFSARIFGASSFVLKTRKDLEKTDFYLKNKIILDEKIGGGFWLWKPYYINELLHQMKENEILLYVDAGIIIRRSINKIILLVKMGSPITLFLNDVPQFKYTKRDVFISLQCDEDKYHTAPLIHAGIQLYRNCDISRAFTKKILDLSCKDRLISDDENMLGQPNLYGFEVHRHDQSIISLIALKNGLTLQLDPTQYRTSNQVFNISNGYHKPSYQLYSPCFFVHRLINFQLLLLFKYLLPKSKKE